MALGNPLFVALVLPVMIEILYMLVLYHKKDPMYHFGKNGKVEETFEITNVSSLMFPCLPGLELQIFFSLVNTLSPNMVW